MAAKMGDPDPDKTPRLRLAVKEAKGQSVAKDVSERAIKKAVGGDAEDVFQLACGDQESGGGDEACDHRMGQEIGKETKA